MSQHHLKEITRLKRDYFIISTLRQKGYDIEKIDVDTDYIASGFFSEVFLVNNSSILKTNKNELNWFFRKNEAEQYQKLVGKKFKNVVDVKHVSIFNSVKSVAIVMEKLQPIENIHRINKKSVTIQTIANFFDLNGLSPLSVFSSIALSKGFSTYKEVISFIEENYPKDKDPKFNMNDYTVSQEEFENIFDQVMNGVAELKSLNIPVDDIHSNNIMQDPSTGAIKIVDFMTP